MVGSLGKKRGGGVALVRLVCLLVVGWVGETRQYHGRQVVGRKQLIEKAKKRKWTRVELGELSLLCTIHSVVFPRASTSCG